VTQDLPEICPRFGHRLRSGLAKSYAVSLTGSFQNQVVAICFNGEGITGDHIPSEAAINVQPLGFVGTVQSGGVLSRDSTRPSRWVGAAMLAPD